MLGTAAQFASRFALSQARRTAFVRAAGCSFVRGMVVLLILSQVAGCTKLRLPAIDPTGRKICNPLPATTSLALPHLSGTSMHDKCLTKIKDAGECLFHKSPEPVFVEPVDPPKCITPGQSAPVVPPKKIFGQKQEPCVPSAPCTEDCKYGPPAVLIGKECLTKDYCKLPNRGKRGGILLSPQKIVAPVGGEVVLLSGICGDNGYLQVGEPLEWMLTPESVGTFIQVGDDDPGFLHTLAKIKKPVKHDPSFARGVTSTKRIKITRGNLTPNDDVQLEKGQTWISISSPSEGTSKVTVLAPESDCWDQRKATATIYWIDAARQFPGTQIVPAGTPVTLTTRVTRSEGTLPARGWKVVYEILQPELASFAGTNGSSFVESTVDDSGNATVQLIPTPDTSGTATIAMKVVRPGGLNDNMPSLTIFTGQTFVNWSAPQLAIRAGAPQIASFGVPFRAVANVSNPGDQPATNVSVVLQVPPGVRAASTDSFATNTPNAVVWQIDQIPPRTELDLFVDVNTESPLSLTFEARADGGLASSDTVTVDVYRPSLAISVTAERDRYEVGQTMAFKVLVRNTGERPLTNLKLSATGDQSMLHTPSNERQVINPRRDATTGESVPLQPGESWEEIVTFISTDPGRRCLSVEATADAGQRGTSEACVVAINPPPPTPSLTLTLAGRNEISMGSEVLFRGVVANTGMIPLTDLRVTMNFDPQLNPLGATEENLVPPQPGQYMLQWAIPRLEPNQNRILEGKFQAIGTSPSSAVLLSAETAEGARTSKRLQIVIGPSAVTQPPASSVAPPTIAPPRGNLPPATSPPIIPGSSPLSSSRGEGDEFTPTTRIVPLSSAESARPGIDSLGLALQGPDGSVRPNAPIRYTLRVTNPARVADSNVSIRLKLPPDVEVQRVSQEMSSDLGKFTRDGGTVYLKEIGSIRPKESIEYAITLRASRAGDFDVAAEVVSAGTKLGARSSTTTSVQ